MSGTPQMSHVLLSPGRDLIITLHHHGRSCGKAPLKVWGASCRLRQVFQKEHSAKLETWQHLVLGGISGASAALATTPLDLIKTRLQVGSAQSVRQAVALTVQEQGPRGFFAGLVRLARLGFLWHERHMKEMPHAPGVHFVITQWLHA